MTSSTAGKQDTDPYALASDGSAADPARFQAALRGDAAKLQELEALPELQAILLGEDVEAMQLLLRQAFKVLSQYLAHEMY